MEMRWNIPKPFKKFTPEKFQLTHCTRARTLIDMKQPLDQAWGKITPKRTMKIFRSHLGYETIMEKSPKHDVSERIRATADIHETLLLSLTGIS